MVELASVDRVLRNRIKDMEHQKRVKGDVEEHLQIVFTSCLTMVRNLL